MTDLQLLVKQTSNPSILKMQQRLHNEVVELGRLALQWKEDCHTLQLALETERDAANLYAKQVAHWVAKHDALLEVEPDEVEWVESEESMRGSPLKEVLKSQDVTVIWHSKKPTTSNPIWEIRGNAFSSL